jgi:hypothetical protein
MDEPMAGALLRLDAGVSGIERHSDVFCHGG